jgi:hypothetical protein
MGVVGIEDETDELEEKTGKLETGKLEETWKLETGKLEEETWKLEEKTGKLETDELEDLNIYEKIQLVMYNFNYNLNSQISYYKYDKRIYTSSDPIPIPYKK